MKWMLTLALLACGCLALQAEDYPVKNLLIEPAELAKHEVAKDLRILDVRSEAAYSQGHVPMAQRVDGNQWAKLFDDGKDVAGWTRRLSELGLTTDSKVVIYDDARNKDAARVWWILKYWGVKDVRLLHGMWTGWKEAGYPQDTKLIVSIRSDFKPQTQGSRLATKKDVLQSLSTKSEGIVDARTIDEHLGKKNLSKHGGCIPGAKNLDWEQLVDVKTSRFKTPAELKELFAQAKIDVAAPQIAHCQGGGRSSVMNFAMELMGATSVRNYHASWGEWGNSDDVPIEKK
ncbi:MAG: rhodanese-like domain-containing protein [Gemmatales bacterium]